MRGTHATHTLKGQTMKVTKWTKCYVIQTLDEGQWSNRTAPMTYLQAARQINDIYYMMRRISKTIRIHQIER